MIEQYNHYNHSSEFNTHDNFVKVLAYYGYYPTRKNSSYMMYKCLQCNEDAYLKTKGKYLQCNHRNNCNYSIDMFGLIMEQEQCNFVKSKDIARQIINDNNIDLSKLEKVKEIKEAVEVKDKNKQIEIVKYYSTELAEEKTRLAKDVMNYLQYRGLSKETIKYFNLGCYNRWIYNKSNNSYDNLASVVMFQGLEPLAYNLRVVKDIDKNNRYGGRIDLPHQKTKVKIHQTSTVYNLDLSSNVIVSEAFFDMMSIHQIKANTEDFTSASLNSTSNINNLVNKLMSNEKAKDKKYYILLDNDKEGIEKSKILLDKMQEQNFNAVNITDKFYCNDLQTYKDCNEILMSNQARLKQQIYNIISI